MFIFIQPDGSIKSNNNIAILLSSPSGISNKIAFMAVGMNKNDWKKITN